MKNLPIFAIGVAYGVLMRVGFGWLPFINQGSAANGPMLAAFVLLVPMLIGFYTVYAARASAPGLGFALVGPWIPTVLFVLGTAMLLLEGSICIAMALPIFLLAASVGGLAGWLLTFVPKPSSGAVHSLLFLPLLLGYAETHLPLPQDVYRSTASIHIAAPPQAVWQLINRATDVRPEEMRGGVAFWMGVPYPLEAITQLQEQGRVRKLRWAKNVSFDEPITAWEEGRFIRWTYSFAPDSFPPGTLDEHVVLGGRYFDLVDTSYELTPADGGTKLTIAINYRVSTNFNWYAARLGRYLVEDSAQTILKFYKARSERAA